MFEKKIWRNQILKGVEFNKVESTTKKPHPGRIESEQSIRCLFEMNIERRVKSLTYECKKLC